MSNIQKKTLQTTNVPVSVLEKADKQAQKEGFSSIQEVIRLFLQNYSTGNIKISFNIEHQNIPNPNAPTKKASERTLRAIKKALEESKRGETLVVDDIDKLDEYLDKYVD